MKNSHRVFFAIGLPKDMQAVMAIFLENLQKQGFSSDIRWTALENLHITLQFLAKLSVQDLPTLIHHVRYQLQNWHAFTVTWEEVILFPQHHPRYLFLTCHPKNILGRLSHDVGQGIIATGYPVEKRHFFPHMTLARFHKSLSHTQMNRNKIIFEPLPNIEVTHIQLLKSMPTQHSSQYTVLAEFPLK